MGNFHKNGVRPTIPRSVSPLIGKLIESCWSVNPESRPTFDEIYTKMEAWFTFFNDVPAKVITDCIWEIQNKETNG
jgi:hypothetical protein